MMNRQQPGSVVRAAGSARDWGQDPGGSPFSHHFLSRPFIRCSLVRILRKAVGLCQELVPTGKSQLRPPGHLITASNLTALRGLTAADQTGTLHVLCRAQFQHSRPSSFQFLSVPLGDQDPPGLSEDAPPTPPVGPPCPCAVLALPCVPRLVLAAVG